MLFDMLGHVPDYGVLKWTDGACPLLQKQEQQHAKLHLECQEAIRRSDDARRRWRWFAVLGETLLLRAGPWLGRTLVGHVEAGSTYWFYLAIRSPFCAGFADNLYIFHAMEEIEHAELTVQALQQRSSPILAAVTLPLTVVFEAIFFLLPPIVRLVAEPSLLLDPRTCPNLLMYYLTFTPAMLGHLWGELVHWVLRFPESERGHTHRLKYLMDTLEARHIEFDIVEQCAYELCQ